MSRMIRMDVLGDFIRADSDTAGVQGEGNVTTVRLSFDPSWDGFAKTMTWWNALEEDPVERTITADLLADLAHDIRTYEAKIPPEPLAVPGLCTLVVDGWRDGQRGRTASLRLKVEAALPRPGPSADPTPTQAEQLQVQIDTILGDMSAQALRAEVARTGAETAQKQAEEAKTTAEAAALSAGQNADRAERLSQLAQQAAGMLEGGSPGQVLVRTGVGSVWADLPPCGPGCGGDPGDGDLEGGSFGDHLVWLDTDGGCFVDGPSPPLPDIDGGPFPARPSEEPQEPEELEQAIAVHNQEVNAHMYMLADCNDDGDDTTQSPSSALLDHANDPNAHRNIVLDGNES